MAATRDEMIQLRLERGLVITGKFERPVFKDFSAFVLAASLGLQPHPITIPIHGNVHANLLRDKTGQHNCRISRTPLRGLLTLSKETSDVDVSMIHQLADRSITHMDSSGPLMVVEAPEVYETYQDVYDKADFGSVVIATELDGELPHYSVSVGLRLDS